MSTVDTSTWNPDPALNESIGDIPLNETASIRQTWQAIQMLMAAGLSGVSALSISGYLYYAYALGLMAVASIIFRFPRKYS